MTETKDLLFEVDHAVGIITLNREEKRNAINGEIIELFNKYLDEIENNPAIRVVLITGAGDKVFCSGADLGGAIGGGTPVDSAMHYAKLLQRMTNFSKPMVAKLNGHCLAGGMGLMLACDIVYAKENIKIGTPEVKVGLFPMMIGALIFKNANRKKALEMIYTADLLPPEKAEQMGLITRVYQADELDQAVDSCLAKICRNAPLAIQLGRQAFAEVEDMPFEKALERLCHKLGEVIQTEDAMEGLAAFMQKRKPEWQGK